MKKKFVKNSVNLKEITWIRIHFFQCGSRIWIRIRIKIKWILSTAARPFSSELNVNLFFWKCLNPRETLLPTLCARGKVGGYLILDFICSLSVCWRRNFCRDPLKSEYKKRKNLNNTSKNLWQILFIFLMKQ